MYTCKENLAIIDVVEKLSPLDILGFENPSPGATLLGTMGSQFPKSPRAQHLSTIQIFLLIGRQLFCLLENITNVQHIIVLS